MENINKIISIDGNSTHHALENFWWSNNDIPPSNWQKSNIVVKAAEFEELLKRCCTPFQIVHRLKDENNPFCVTSIKAYRKGLNAAKFLIAVDYQYNTDEKEVEISVEMLFDASNTEYAKSFAEAINSLIIRSNEKSPVYMVIQDSGRLILRSFDIDNPKIDIELNYGKEWLEKHNYLLSVLNRENKKGIALLHGMPGTGKSVYIRYLISIMSKDRTVIYLPNQLIKCLTDPSFLPLMSGYPNSILIIEDAESAIKSRKTGGTTVDNLLNLTDGIISDFLGTQIICTFNNDISLIDEALLRKGRLILKHEFKKLPKEQAQKLSDSLGFTSVIDKDMTLTDIYNQNDKFTEEKQERASIGFGSK